jgi:hypothetical protein
MKTYSSNRANLPLVTLLPLLAALAAACGGRAFSAGHENVQGEPSAQDASAMSSDASGLENREASAGGGASAPPLSIQGVSLWLDGDMGVSVGANGIERWADRSGQGHVFLGQTAGDAKPQLGRLAGHGAVRFNTRNRMIIERSPTAEQQKGLTFGLEGFLVAVVFQTESKPPFGPGPITPLVIMLGPWIPAPLTPDFTLTASGNDPVALSFMGSMLTAEAGRIGVDLGYSYGPGLPHMVMFVMTAGGQTLAIRADGQPAGTASNSQPVISPLDYRPVYIGDWDFDLVGFGGTVGELVVVKGATDGATVSALEGYLKAKYGL